MTSNEFFHDAEVAVGGSSRGGGGGVRGAWGGGLGGRRPRRA